MRCLVVLELRNDETGCPAQFFGLRRFRTGKPPINESLGSLVFSLATPQIGRVMVNVLQGDVRNRSGVPHPNGLPRALPGKCPNPVSLHQSK